VTKGEASDEVGLTVDDGIHKTSFLLEIGVLKICYIYGKNSHRTERKTIFSHPELFRELINNTHLITKRENLLVEKKDN